MSGDDLPAPGATMEVHFKLFGTDGVSLQSQELSAELRRRGWRVHSCASDVPAGVEGLRLPELAYQSDDAVALRRRLFGPTAGSTSGAALLETVEARAEPIRRRIESYLGDHGVRVLHVRNLMSLPYNLPATFAVHRLASQRPDLGFVMQHHDFYWEGPNARTFETPYPEVVELMDRVMCPDLPNVIHVLINPIAAEALLERRGIAGTVVPDGFDFDRRATAIDPLEFRRRLTVLVGDPRPVAEDDLVVVMPARVAINKAIELAIQLVAGLDRERARLAAATDGLGRARRRFTAASRVVLLLPQGEDIGDNRDYLERLVAYARHLGITLAYGGDLVVPDRSYNPGDRDHYPFYSTYQAVDLVCYPPEHEGFGNQAIEAIWARRPLAVLEYPVFLRFVRDHVPHFISLGDTGRLGRLEGFGGLHLLAGDVLAGAVEDTLSVLTDHALERRWTEENASALRAFCGIGTVAERYISLYRRAAGTGPPDR